MRRAPIYLLIDKSGSMSGEAITSVKNGIDIFFKFLRSDPECLEKAYVSIITFGDRAEKVLDLTHVYDIVTLPKLEAGGTTSMGDAIRVLNESLNSDLIENTAEEKGDFKAFVVVFTDGRATDKSVLETQLKTINRRKINYFIAATTSEDEDVKKTLVDITSHEENVIFLPTVNTETFKKFFSWVTQSFSASFSRGAEIPEEETRGSLGELPPLPSFTDEGGLL